MWLMQGSVFKSPFIEMQKQSSWDDPFSQSLIKAADNIVYFVQGHLGFF